MIRFFLAVLLLCSAPASAQDLFVFNANGYTQQYGALTPFDALLIKDGRVQAVGTKALLQPFAGDAVQRDLDGKTLLPGFVHAHDALSALCGNVDEAGKQTCLLDVMRARKRYGFTLIHDTATSAVIWTALEALRDTKALPIRVYAAINDFGAFYDTVSRPGPNVGRYDGMLFLRAISLGARSGKVAGSGKGNWTGNGKGQQQGCGAAYVATHTPAAQRNRIARGVLKGYQMRLMAHSADDFSAILDAYEDVIAIAGTAGRHVIAPLGITNLEMATRLADLGLAVPLGACNSSVGALLPLASADVSVALAADMPFQAIEEIARSTAEPEARSAAFAAATMGGAHAAFLEQAVGSLEPGKWADFIVVNQDIFTVSAGSISETMVLETWVAGRQVFDVKG